MKFALAPFSENYYMVNSRSDCCQSNSTQSGVKNIYFDFQLEKLTDVASVANKSKIIVLNTHILKLKNV